MTAMTAVQRPSSAPPGVSVAICTYNGVARLPRTLEHLRVQIVPPEIPWEVIVIDNASTDETAETARQFWADNSPVRLRVVDEPRQGLSYARERAFAEAEYEIVSFIDDDNWVGPEWVARVATLMAAHPEVGACAPIVEANCEKRPPDWCKRLSLYSKWPRGEYAGDVSDTLGELMGAGLTIRAQAYRGLCASGFRQLTLGRTGNILTACEDSELCLALRLAGWRLWIEPTLRVRHFVPSRRINWDYFRGLTRGYAFSTVALDPYLWALRSRRNEPLNRFSEAWSWQAAVVLRDFCQNLLTRPQKVFFRGSPRFEGDPDVLRIESYIGRLQGLLHARKTYATNLRAVSRASWQQCR